MFLHPAQFDPAFLKWAKNRREHKAEGTPETTVSISPGPLPSNTLSKLWAYRRRRCWEVGGAPKCPHPGPTHLLLLGSTEQSCAPFSLASGNPQTRWPPQKAPLIGASEQSLSPPAPGPSSGVWRTQSSTLCPQMKAPLSPGQGDLEAISPEKLIKSAESSGPCS